MTVTHVPLLWQPDHGAEEVARLVNDEGMDQLVASRLVYADLPTTPEPPVWNADRDIWSDWCRRHARALFVPLARKVGLS